MKRIIRGKSKLTAGKADDPHAVILSFHDRWRVPLIEGKVNVVFRKRGPKRFSPDLMYAYVSTPTSAIIVKMQIHAFDKVPIADAEQLAEEGAMHQGDLIKYAESYDELIVMRVGDLCIAKSPVSHSLLGEKYNFWPSSTFIPLSDYGIEVLDRLADFQAFTGGDNSP